jgi:hypothetical protein
LRLNIYNAMNVNSVTNWTLLSGPNFLKPTAIVPPGSRSSVCPTRSSAHLVAAARPPRAGGQEIEQNSGTHEQDRGQRTDDRGVRTKHRGLKTFDGVVGRTRVVFPGLSLLLLLFVASGASP